MQNSTQTNTSAVNLPAVGDQIKIDGAPYVVTAVCASAANSNVNNYLQMRGRCPELGMVGLRKPRGSKDFVATLFANGAYSRVTAL